MISSLICELCAASEFDPVWLPDAGGNPVQASDLLVCRQCRSVYLPRAGRPAMINPARPSGPGEPASQPESPVATVRRQPE